MRRVPRPSAPFGRFSVANGPTTIFTAPDTAQASLRVTGGTATKDFEVVAPPPLPWMSTRRFRALCMP